VSIGNIARIAESDNSGGGSNGNSSRAVLSLVNLEEDRISKNPQNFIRTADGIAYRNPKLHFNLYALFAVTASTYATALQTLSLIIQCFQSDYVFSVENYPSLDTSLDKLQLELTTLNFEQINHLWSTLGGKYYPSVLYKVKLIGILDEEHQIGGDLIREIVTPHNLITPNT